MEGRHVGLDFYDLLIEAQSRYYDNLDDISVRKSKNALLALIPHVQEVGIAGGGNIAVAFVNGTI
jgi:hypothetical protein